MTMMKMCVQVYIHLYFFSSISSQVCLDLFHILINCVKESCDQMPINLRSNAHFLTVY